MNIQINLDLLDHWSRSFNIFYIFVESYFK